MAPCSTPARGERSRTQSRTTAPELTGGLTSPRSCCGIERIYVDASIYDDFVAKFTEITNNYVLGDPREETTTLGPVISIQSAKRIRAQVADAVKAGARTLIDESKFKVAKEGSAYVAPQVLVDVDHSMDIMSEESFGPVVGIMKVRPVVKCRTSDLRRLTTGLRACALRSRLMRRRSSS